MHKLFKLEKTITIIIFKAIIGPQIINAAKENSLINAIIILKNNSVIITVKKGILINPFVTLIITELKSYHAETNDRAEN